MSGLTRGGTAEPVLQDQILRHEWGQEEYDISCSADYKQGWQPYPVDPYSAKRADSTIYVSSWKSSQLFRRTKQHEGKSPSPRVIASCVPRKVTPRALTIGLLFGVSMQANDL